MNIYSSAYKILRQICVFIQTLPFISIITVTFIVSNKLENGVISSKYFWFYFSMEFIAVLFLRIISKKKKIKFGVNDTFILTYMLILFLFFTYSHYYIITTKHILLILLILLYFYIRLIFQINKNAIYWLKFFFIFAGLVESIWGLRQLYGFEQSQHLLFRLTGSFFNPGPFSCYIAIVFPMAFYYTLKYRNCYKANFHIRNISIYLLWGMSIITITFSILILPTTISRTAWIACIGGCGLVLLDIFAKNKTFKDFVTHYRKKYILAISIAALLIITGGFGMYILKKDSADGRTFIWKNTIELIKQNPFGVGIGNFSGSYGHIQSAYFESGKGTEDEKRVAGNPEYAFNESLQICAEQGIIVFLLFMCIVGYSLYIGIKRKKVAATSSLLAMLIVAGASYPFSLLPFLIALVLLIALIHNGEKGISIPKPVSVVFVCCGLIIVSLCLYNRYPTYDAYKKWNKVKILYSFGNNKESVKEYRNIYPLLSDQIKFLFEYAQCLNRAELYEESNEVLINAVKISCDPMLYNVMGKNFHALKQYAKAEMCFIKSSNIVPSRLYPYYLMALMYVDAGEAEKAKEMAQIVLTKEPKVQSTAVKEMRQEMKKLLE